MYTQCHLPLHVSQSHSFINMPDKAREGEHRNENYWGEKKCFACKSEQINIAKSGIVGMDYYFYFCSCVVAVVVVNN